MVSTSNLDLDDDFLLEDNDENEYRSDFDEDIDNENEVDTDNVEVDSHDDYQEENDTEESFDINAFQENDSINYLLQSKGLDPHAILYENEDGEEEEVNFYDLPLEEQMNILNYNHNDYNLNEEEINTISFLRDNNIDLEEYTAYIKEKAIEEYKNNNISYDVDSFSDDEIYSAFLKDSYDLSDEEIAIELEKQKESDLYSKKVEKIRALYKEQEDTVRQEAEKTKLEEEQKEIKEAQNKLATAAASTNNFMGFELEDEDRREALKFIFERDATGKSKFYKMFDDPEKLFRIALFAVKEDEISNTINRELSKAYNTRMIPKVDLKKTKQKEKVVIGKGNKSSQSHLGTSLGDDDLLIDLLK